MLVKTADIGCSPTARDGNLEQRTAPDSTRIGQIGPWWALGGPIAPQGTPGPHIALWRIVAYLGIVCISGQCCIFGALLNILQHCYIVGHCLPLGFSLVLGVCLTVGCLPDICVLA